MAFTLIFAFSARAQDFMWVNDSDMRLWKVSISDGQFHYVGTMANNMTCMAFDRAGTLYGFYEAYNYSILCRINPTNAATSELHRWDSGTAAVKAMTFDYDGNLWAAEDDVLWRIDVASLTRTQVGSGQRLIPQGGMMAGTNGVLYFTDREDDLVQLSRINGSELARSDMGSGSRDVVGIGQTASGSTYGYSTTGTDEILLISLNGGRAHVIDAANPQTIRSGCMPMAMKPAVAPAISAQPQSIATAVGATISFYVSATGTEPLHYQWWRNQVPVAGATSSAHLVGNVQMADSGSRFSVVVSNIAGSVTSAVAVLTVTNASAAPMISSQPQSRTNLAGTTANFSITASGTAPLCYQWRRGGAPIAGATVASYSLANVQMADSGSLFSVVVSNSAGSVTSIVAVLTVTNLPSGGSLPSPWQNQDIGAVGLAGSANYTNGTFTVRGSGTDIWETNDQFHFVHQWIQGDVELIARVAGIQTSHEWAKAGIMIRESLAPDSRHAMMCLTTGHGTDFQYRTDTSAATETDWTSNPPTAPCWVKLLRRNGGISGYQSTDGANWTLMFVARPALPDRVALGLAVTAHDNAALNTSVFDSVTVRPVSSLNPTASLRREIYWGPRGTEIDKLPILSTSRIGAQWTIASGASKVVSCRAMQTMATGNACPAGCCLR